MESIVTANSPIVIAAIVYEVIFLFLIVIAIPSQIEYIIITIFGKTIPLFPIRGKLYQ